MAALVSDDQRAVTLGKIIDSRLDVAPAVAALDQARLADKVYQPSAATITNVDPATGGTAGGTEVTITGTNLAGTSAVLFDGTPGTSLSVTDDTEVVVTTPAGTGAVDVVLVTPAGAVTEAGGFTYS